MKKIIAFILITACVLMFAGCSMAYTGSSSPANSSSITTSASTSTSASTTSTSKNTSDYTVDEPENTQSSSSSSSAGSKNISTVSIQDLTDFSEGRAWITYLSYSASSMMMALIDTHGDILWESKISNQQNIPSTGEFKNGLAYFSLGGSKWTYYIIDSDGNVTFTMPDNDDFKFLGQYDDLFFVAQHISNIDVDEWQIGSIDRYGNTVVPFKSLEISTHEKFNPNKVACYNHGEGVFQFESYEVQYDIFVNAKTNEIIFDNNTGINGISVYCLTEFENGAATVSVYNPEQYKEKYYNAIGTLHTDGTLTDLVVGDWIERQLRYTDEFSEGLAFYSGGDELNNTGCYVNYVGEVIIDFPQYESRRYYYGGPFRNGHALMEMKGADGELYFTVIDREGNEMFSPIASTTAYLSDDGKYVFDGSTVMDIYGNPLLSIKNKNISYTFDGIHDGVVRIRDSYINIEEKRVIGSGIFAEYTLETY